MEPSKAQADALKARIRNVPDFPKPGILFYDITTLLKDRDGFGSAIDAMAASHIGRHIDVVVGIESRGFIFAASIADRLCAGFVPVRKPGKLPSKTSKATYALDYGHVASAIHTAVFIHGQLVLLWEDLLATAGTPAPS